MKGIGVEGGRWIVPVAKDSRPLFVRCAQSCSCTSHEGSRARSILTTGGRCKRTE